MDKKLSNLLSQREHSVLTDIDVITAAVAVPLLEIDGEDHVVFTVRSNTLRRQPGEISFPGGHCEPNDKSARKFRLFSICYWCKTICGRRAPTYK